MKLLPFRRGYGFAVVGLIIGACHSGETRDPVAIDPGGNNGSDSGSDAASDSGQPSPSLGGSAGFAGSVAQPDSGDDGVGGTISAHGGSDAGTDADASDAEIPDSSDLDGGPRCGDGNTDIALDEECDDGNELHSDGCERDCTTTRVTQVAIGYNFMCALSSGGGVKCWGKDLYGTLGRATSTVDVPDPSQIDVIDFGTSRRVTQIASSWYHVCALFEDGRARCWGRNDSYQLGTGNTFDYGDGPGEELRNLGDLPLDGIKFISAGQLGTCAISDVTGANKLYCWGSNLRGELGVGNTSARPEPTDNYPAVLGATPLQTAGGYRAVCSLLAGGSVRCHGDRIFGQLGAGVISHDIGDGIGDGNGFGELPNDPMLSVKGLPGA
ncbi:MAG TPA: hypothetical protein VHO25_17520, partial [Polyangiaceae bacterium]|nr:hypothetical protein [Polyangiaceae bacterium]